MDRAIAFARLDQDTGSAQLWTMTFEGLKQTNVSNDAASFSESGPGWSADGSKLLFVRQPPGSFPGDQGGGPATAGGEIWIRNADGSGTHDAVEQQGGLAGPRQLTTTARAIPYSPTVCRRRSGVTLSSAAGAVTRHVRSHV